MEQQAKHTPGPWRFKEEIGTHGELCFLSIAQAFPEGDYSYRGHVCTVSEAEHINGITAEERDANARLIAAAPDLLEACLAMVAWDDAEKSAKPYDEDGGAGFFARIAMCAEAFDKARAAIAKALPPAPQES